MVHFVGAGSGAVDLITVRGARLLSQADVIIYAGSLVNPELLQYARKDCALYNSAEMTLEDVISIIKQAEQEGKGTVRLHTGDPSIYGAVREQFDKLDEAGIPYDVCPGVSSFCGAAASLKAEYTLPDISQTVIISRESGRTPVPQKESVLSLAQHDCTMVFFLSIGVVRQLQEDLTSGGMDENTPAAIVYKSTWPDERIFRCTLGTLAAAAEENGIRKTALVLVGKFLGKSKSRSMLYHPDFSTEYRKGDGHGI